MNSFQIIWARDVSKTFIVFPHSHFKESVDWSFASWSVLWNLCCQRDGVTTRLVMFYQKSPMSHQKSPHNVLVLRIVVCALTSVLWRRWRDSTSSPKLGKLSAYFLELQNEHRWFFSRHALTTGSALTALSPYTLHSTWQFPLFRWEMGNRALLMRNRVLLMEYENAIPDSSTPRNWESSVSRGTKLDILV